MAKIYKGERTRNKILKESIKLFARNGFMDTSIQKIADKCQISQTTVLQHYKTKNILLAAVRAKVTDSNYSFIDNLISPKDDAYTCLVKHCLGNLQWALESRQEAQIILLTYYYSSFDKKFKEAGERALTRGRERISLHLLEMQKQNQLKTDTDIVKLGEQIHEYLIGAFVRSLSLQVKLSPQQIKSKVQAALELILSGSRTN